MGSIEGSYYDGQWHWRNSGIFTIIDVIRENNRKNKEIEEIRKENNRLLEEENNKRKREIEIKNKIEKKINDIINKIENDFIKNFNIKEIIIPKKIKINIINNCKTFYNMREKIKNEIKKLFNSFSKQRNKNKFTIFISGNTGNGKSTLLNSCFNKNLSKESKNKPCHDFKIPHLFSCENLPDFEIYDTNGNELIGENNITNRLKEISDFINEKSNDKDKMIDCIWYCITGNKFQELEFDFLKKLNEIYYQKLPIIIVYTQTTNLELAKNIKEYINQFNLNNEFIPVLAKDVEIINNIIIKKFGINELISKTRELVIKNELSLNKVNILNKIKKNLKNQYSNYNYDYTNLNYLQFIEKYFNINNEIELNICKMTMKNNYEKLKDKIINENVDQFSIKIKEETQKIMIEYGILYDSDLNKIINQFKNKLSLKIKNSKKISNKIIEEIIDILKDFNSNIVNEEIPLLTLE